MAKLSRRETLIALRARRTAHRVATDVFLSKVTQPVPVECVQCHRQFMPARYETVCPGCSPPPLPVRLEYRNVLPATWEDHLRVGLSRPQRNEWPALVVVLALLGLSIFAFLYAVSH